MRITSTELSQEAIKGLKRPQMRLPLKRRESQYP